MTTKEKELFDVWGNPIYEGSVIMIIDDGRLTPKIIYKIKPNTFQLLTIKSKTISYNVNGKTFPGTQYWKAREYAYSLVGYIEPKYVYNGPLSYNQFLIANSAMFVLRDNAIALVKFINKDVLKNSNFKIRVGSSQDHIVVVDNPLFKINVKGFAELFETVDRAKTCGILPEEYKVGKRIVHEKNKTISLYKEEIE